MEARIHDLEVAEVVTNDDKVHAAPDARLALAATHDDRPSDSIKKWMPQ